MCLLNWVWSRRKGVKGTEEEEEEDSMRDSAAGQGLQDQDRYHDHDQGQDTESITSSRSWSQAKAQAQAQAQEQGQEHDLQQTLKQHVIQDTSSSTNVASETPPSITITSQTSIPRAQSSFSPFEGDDWTSLLPDSEHIRFFRKTDWAASHLGPLSLWSRSLRQSVFMVLADSRAACVYWGPHRVAIYNKEFIPLAGNTHPSLMSSRFQDSFPELWHQIQPVFHEAETSGMASSLNEMEMFVERNAFLEQAFFSGNFVPLRGNSGKVEGFYNSVHEVTKAKINERRRVMLNSLQIPAADDKRRLASHILPMLKEHPWDFPMALIYKVDETEPGSCCLLLRANIGFPEDHPLAVKSADINSDVGLMPLLRKARWKMLTIPIDESFDGIKWTGFGEPSRSVTFLPIAEPRRLYGFLVLGSNPRRPVDEDYFQFMQDLCSKASSIAGSILSAEETRKREAALQKELADRMRQIRYMAENASVGMQYIAVNGSLSWANDEYYRLTEHPREEEFQYPLSFMDVFIEEDRPKAMDIWHRLVHGETSISTEIHLKRVFNPPSGEPEPAIVLIHFFRVMEDDQLKSLMAFTTDVSAFKWAEASEARKAAAAQEAKRQQEEFIDFVSHELRNPLSAIFQLAETIITSFPTSTKNVTTNSELIEALKENIDNAETILMCAKHQKRIVDDVLTLSKLEYTMLSVSPLPVQVPELVDKWMKMFESQLQSHHITILTKAHPSLQNHVDDWILCDESRIQQIFINLMTNAIKFTKAEGTRQIEVEYGVTSSNPRDSFPKDIRWAPNHREVEDLTEHPEWGLGQPLYFTISVTDTGIGMTNDEIKKLFGRFKQANARTSIKYGGSGLGLFLSGRLAEKQSGEIGVSSQSGQGSTFAFYVKSRRTEKHGVSTPENAQVALPIRARSMSLVHQIPVVDFNKIHVLLVEDNVVNQRIIQKQLLKAGCVVYVANHGLEALDMVRKSDIWHEKSAETKHLDIILMDWQMPVMDGLTASREIRKLEAEKKITRHLEIIATTANARDEQIETAIASGIDSVMSKPFMVSDLLIKMKERLSIASSGDAPNNTAGYSFWE
ncbi:related to autoinducer 2 sensor kinase/phosphatase luxQ [Rhynchosporium secalis]|uniref:histidine kinase n=1 Tax=Rhynchosporium secalis TaxID=38038 RepID=A0A1E1MR66_RHYSE|nr:related to autoinducer 2 sensor kinase/phosphatase luxQ [Rhynchosporium secalis]